MKKSNYIVLLAGFCQIFSVFGQKNGGKTEVEPKELTPAVQIYFNVSESEIKPAEQAKLTTLVSKLKKMKEYRLVLTGHTDSTGNDDYNMELSRDRVDAVYDLLSDLEIPEDFMMQKYFGRSKPRENESDKEMKARNRRVEITIIEKPKVVEKVIPKPINDTCTIDTTIKLAGGMEVTLSKCDFIAMNKRKPGKGVVIKKTSDIMGILKSGYPLTTKTNEGMQWLGIVEFGLASDTCLRKPVTVSINPQDFDGYQRARMRVYVRDLKNGKMGSSKDRSKSVKKKKIGKDAIKFDVTARCPTGRDEEGAILIASGVGKSKQCVIKDKSNLISEVYVVAESPTTIIPAERVGNKFIVKYSKLTNASFVFKLEDGSFTEPISTESVKKTGKKDIARKSLRKKYKIKERHLRS